MTISIQTSSPSLVTGSDSSQPLGSTGSSAAGDSPFAVVLKAQQQQATAAAATAKPAAAVAGSSAQTQVTAAPSPHGPLQAVLVNGRPYITQCYTYDDLGIEGNVYQISGAQVEGMAVRIYDPSGQRPDVELQPGDDVVAVMRANNIAIQATDQGVSYEYGRLFNQNWTPDVSSGKKDPHQLEAEVVQQMLGDGWSRESLAPWINQVASYGLTPVSTASPAPTGSLPVSTADPVAAGMVSAPGLSTPSTSALALAETPVAAAQDTAAPEEAAVAPVAAAADTATLAVAASAPSSTDRVGADAVGPAPATNSAPLASLYQDLQSAAVKASPDNATAAGSSGVEWTPADWAQQVRQLTSNPDVLPPLDQIFPQVDLQQPMTLVDFWAGAQDSIRL
jgi:hypothetical protein